MICACHKHLFLSKLIIISQYLEIIVQCWILLDTQIIFPHPHKRYMERQAYDHFKLILLDIEMPTNIFSNTNLTYIYIRGNALTMTKCGSYKHLQLCLYLSWASLSFLFHFHLQRDAISWQWELEFTIPNFYFPKQVR